MKKKMLIMLACVIIFFGLLFGWKGIKIILMKHYLASHQEQAITVSTMKANQSIWHPKLKTVGTIRAIVGVSITTELAGMVKNSYILPGKMVKKGDVLVQLNADSELGQLKSLEAQVELAKITFNRDQAQYKIHAVSKQTVDSDEWNLKNLEAQVIEQAATVQKKTLIAPFSGRLGISNVNPGQYLTPGDKVSTLQTLDPIYVDFYMPQQALADLKLNQIVKVKTDTYLNQIFQGKITTIEPLIDLTTRNVLVEATLVNSQNKLVPGMFVSVDVETANSASFITLPQTAVTFNPYGEMVYVVKQNKATQKDAEHKKQSVLIATQVFVTTGDTRGDQIAIIKGLKPGDEVVTSGQLKLKNGSVIVVNNLIKPGNNPSSQVPEK